MASSKKGDGELKTATPYRESYLRDDADGVLRPPAPQPPPTVTFRCSSQLLSLSADARSSDDVTAFERSTVTLQYDFERIARIVAPAAASNMPFVYPIPEKFDVCPPGWGPNPNGNLDFKPGSDRGADKAACNGTDEDASTATEFCTSACRPCLAGSVSANAGGSCSSCPHASVQMHAGKSTCIPCEPNFQSNGNQTECIACSSGWQRKHTEGVCTAKKNQLDAAVVGGAIAASCVIMLVAAAIVRYRAYQKKMRAFDFTGEIERLRTELDAELKRKGAPSVIQTLKVPREIKRSFITTTGALGHGAFGDVFKGILVEKHGGFNAKSDADEAIIVAIKSAQVSAKGKVEQEAEAAALMHEATLMVQLPAHENVVAIIGVVTVGTPLLLVISYCELGSLLHYLGKYNVSLGSKLLLSRNIAAGMAHISQCRMIHRDIAARNVLITEKEVAQIADFGLARLGREQGDEYDNMHEVYYKSLNGCFPVRWTAPEGTPTM